jgi:hypothetical protein
MKITHEENQAIIDNMYARGIKSYINGTDEEIAAVERHRAASPYKVGCEPDYSIIPIRLPRKRKKEIKKLLKSGVVRPSFVGSDIHKWVSKKYIRMRYLSIHRLLKSINRDRCGDKNSGLSKL